MFLVVVGLFPIAKVKFFMKILTIASNSNHFGIKITENVVDKLILKLQA
jgi:hypothetical protein